MGERRYWAFISYSHADESVARWLHKSLETFRIPSKLVGACPGGVTIPRRLFPIFRDRDELPSSESLGGRITDALDRSDAMIVIASRRSAKSVWCNQEIRRFKASGKAARLFCLIIDGEPFASDRGAPEQECLAPALRFEIQGNGELGTSRAEPIAADLREGRGKRRDVLLSLVAGILNLGLDDLKQRDLVRRQKQLRLVAAASVAAAAVTTGLSIAALQARDEARQQRAVAENQRAEAQAQRELAELRQRQAEDLIQFMLGDFRDKLAPIGKLELLDSIGEQAMAYFAQLPAENSDDTSLAARALALRQIGDVRVRQGRLADAAPAFQQALRLDQELVRRNPDDQQALFNVSQSQFYVGYGHFLNADYAAALPWFQRYAASAEHLIALAPDNLDWRRERQYALDTLATIHLRSADYARCIEYAGRSVEGSQALLAQHAGDKALRVAMASSLFKQAHCHWKLGNLAAQHEVLMQEREIERGLVREFPDDVDIQLRLALTSAFLGRGMREAGRLDEAEDQLQAAHDLTRSLVAHDPDNAQWAAHHAQHLIELAELQVLRRDYRQALRHLAAARPLIESGRTMERRQHARRQQRFWLLTALLAPRVNDAALEATARQGLRELLPDLLVDMEPVEPLSVVACGLLDDAGPCSKVTEGALPEHAERERFIALALRQARVGQSLKSTEAGQTLTARNYHGAIWHLLQNPL